MKKSMMILTAVAVLAAATAGYFIGQRDHATSAMSADTASSDKPGEPTVLYWKAPMDANFRSDKPGKSPMGMDLVPVYADEGKVGDSSDVRIDPSVVNNLGVRTAEVERGALGSRIEAVGYVGYDEDTLTSINTRAEGWVEKLAVKSVGETVRKGQLLYALFSPKLTTAEREYLTAMKSGSQSLITASRQRMHSLGFSNAQIKQLASTGKVGSRVGRYAQSAGVVVKLGVSEGAAVTPATQVMQLADLATVWVLVEIDPVNGARVRKGQGAEVSFDAFPGESWKGEVDYIYPDVSATTRTVKVRLRLPNPERRLQPNMYARVTLHTETQHGVLTIPLLALIETGHSKRVIVAQGGGRFDVCPVQTGAISGDRVEILQGLRPGQRVVTSAQFMIDSEANVDAAALRLDSGKPGCGEPAAPASEHADHEHMPGMDMSGPDPHTQHSKPVSTAPHDHSEPGPTASHDHAEHGVQP